MLTRFPKSRYICVCVKESRLVITSDSTSSAVVADNCCFVVLLCLLHRRGNPPPGIVKALLVLILSMTFFNVSRLILIIKLKRFPILSSCLVSETVAETQKLNRAAVACARLSDSIRSGNLLKAKLRRARLGKGGGGGGKIVSLQPPRVFRISYY